MLEILILDVGDLVFKLEANCPTFSAQVSAVSTGRLRASVPRGGSRVRSISRVTDVFFAKKNYSISETGIINNLPDYDMKFIS